MIATITEASYSLVVFAVRPFVGAVSLNLWPNS